jgi:hypothetical protein
MYHAALRHQAPTHAQNPQLEAGRAGFAKLCNALICQGKVVFLTFYGGAAALLSYR